jgi:coatomer protein complex subunit gamma
VDRDPAVAAAALVSGLHLASVPANLELLRRWVPELSEAMKSQHPMVQYLALGLLATVRGGDVLATSKLVLGAAKAGVFQRGPLASLALTRLAIRLVGQPAAQADHRSLLELLESGNRSKHEMVAYEAARATALLGSSAKDLLPAVSVLQAMLSASRAPTRFAAVRALHSMAASYPLVAAACNVDLELLIQVHAESLCYLPISQLCRTPTSPSRRCPSLPCCRRAPSLPWNGC